jgi:8-oxo-dGTP pyrophosphatase MutT (NUDIX family)
VVPVTRVSTPRHAALLGQLRDYTAADALEARHQRDIVNLLTDGGDSFSRGHFEPGHITASLFIVDPAMERLLLHHHRRLDRWLQLGGHVEGDEDPKVAALREGREESGLCDLELVVDGIFDLDVHVIPAAKGEPDHRHFDVRYLARTSTPEAIALDAAESKALAWVVLVEGERRMNEAASSRVVAKIAAMLR